MKKSTAPTERDLLIASLKGAFSTHEIIDVELSVSTADGFEKRVLVPAVKLSYDWALHREIGGMRWACTHIPSGVAILPFSEMAQALMSLGVMIALDLRWNAIASNDDMQRVLISKPAVRRAAAKALEIVKGMKP